jgi:hypothetical protein
VIEAERAARVARVRSDRGWLTVVRKIFLDEGTTTIGAADLPPGAPERVGAFAVAGRRVTFTADAGAKVTLASGEPVVSRVLRTDAERDPDTLACGGFLFQIMERGDSLAVRVRDVRTLPAPFAGIDYFAIDPAWSKRATLVRHATPTRIAIEFEGATDGAIEETMESPGILVFEHEGQRIEMDALVETGGSRLYVPFRDATNGEESYDAGRFVYAPLPIPHDDGGAVSLDFNRAMIPGCAFTVHATCPIPPRRNRLRIAVRAGEKSYRAEPIGS